VKEEVTVGRGKNFNNAEKEDIQQLCKVGLDISKSFLFLLSPFISS